VLKAFTIGLNGDSPKNLRHQNIRSIRYVDHNQNHYKSIPVEAGDYRGIVHKPAVHSGIGANFKS